MLKSQHALDQAFRALGDSARRGILEQLSHGEMTMSALAAPLSISLSAVHQHVAVLEEAHLVRCEKRGRSRWCRLDRRGFDRVEAWVGDRQRYWDARLDALARHLASEKRPKTRKGAKP